MYAKAAFFLFAFFLLLLPILNADHSVIGTAPGATAEPTAEPTAEATPEPTAVAVVGDPARGDVLFHQGMLPAPACINCHSTTVTGKNGFALGPGLLGIRTTAATRVEGLAAEEYIEQSIRHPGAYIVSGFRDIMYQTFDTDYTDQDIADIIAYLMTL